MTEGVTSGREPAQPIERKEGGRDFLPNFYRVAMGSIRWVALGVVVVTLFARALAPAFPGYAVGFDRLTNRVELVAEIATQLVTFFLVVLVVTLVVEVARSRAPLALRMAAIMLSSITALMVASSVGNDRAPLILLLVSCMSASSLAILGGADAVRQPTIGWLGAAPILVGVASSMRAVAVLVAERAALLPRSEGVEGARVLATVAFGLHTSAVLVGLAWLATRGRRASWIGALVAGVVAALVSWSIARDSSDPGHLYLLVKHGVGNLLSLPVPYVPVFAEVSLTVTSFVLAFFALAQRREVAGVVASLALFSLVGGSGEVPVFALSLVAATLAFTMASRDARGVWAAIQASDPPRPA